MKVEEDVNISKLLFIFHNLKVKEEFPWEEPWTFLHRDMIP
jgi:hypothetical protein